MVSSEFFHFLEWETLIVIAALGLAWGFLLTPIVPIAPRTQAVLAILGGLAFFLVLAGIRALVSHTPPESIGRELAHVVLWALYIGTGYVGWLIRIARR